MMQKRHVAKTVVYATNKKATKTAQKAKNESLINGAFFTSAKTELKK